MTASQGWVKLNRSILDHWIWQDLEFYRAWTTLIMIANYEPKRRPFNGEIVTVESGQILGSVPYFAKATGLSIKRWRTLQKLLEKDGMIQIENTPKGARLTICNYSTYQVSGHAGGTLGARNGHAKGITIKREEVKNTYYHKNDSIGNDSQSDESAPKQKRVTFHKPTFEEVAAYANERQWWDATNEAQKFYDYQESVGWTVGRKPMKDWRAAMRTWERTLPVHPRKVLEYFRDKMTEHEGQYFADTQAELFWKHYTATDWKTGTGQRIGKKFEAHADKWIATYRRGHQ